MRISLAVAPGLRADDTSYGSKGFWYDGNMVRFRLGRPQVYGGWESLVTALLTGVCRAVFPWTDNSAVLNIAFGTHQKVQVWQGGVLYDITPFGPPTALANNPLSVVNTTATVTVHHVAHGYLTGQSLKVFGATAVGGITPNGTFTITKDDADRYHFTFGSNATSTVSGGGSAIVVTPQSVLPAGAVDGTGSVGYGTGAYSAGPWGETPPTADYFPRTWDFAAWGQNLLASPRAGGLYQWQNDTTQKLVAVDNAPVQMTAMLVAPMNGGYMCFALGTNQEADGVFNPMCIRHCSVRTLGQWSTLADGSTAREYVLTGGGRIVTGRMIGPYLAVWTNDSLWIGNFTGALNQPWSFERQGTKCGLIGPKAVVVVGQSAFWVSPDRQFYKYDLGGSPGPMECPVREDFAENLAAAQSDKIVASSCAEFGEVRWDYPDGRDGFENSRFVAMGLVGSDAGAWHRGIMARTAFMDAGPSLYPIGVTFAGNAYYHERGNSADGSPFAWSITTADQVLDINWRLLIKEIWPDFKDQLGPVTLTIDAREAPQGDSTLVSAPAMAPGDRKADFMVTGRNFKLTFAGSSAPTNCRIGSPVFEVERAGKL